MEVILSNDSEVQTHPKRYIAKKNHDKIKKYLGAFNIHAHDDVDKDSASVAKHMSKVRKAFNDLKKSKMTKRAFGQYEQSENYDNDLENHYDSVQEAANFQGFESEMHDFLPMLLPLGKKILKGGISAIKKKIGKGKTSGGSAQSDDEHTNGVHKKVRDNIQSVGIDQWLSDSKKQQINKLLAQGREAEMAKKIEAGLVRAGVSPDRFRHYQDETGSYNGKAKDILSDIINHEKDGEIAKGKLDATPQIVVIAVVALIAGLLIAKFVK